LTTRQRHVALVLGVVLMLAACGEAAPAGSEAAASPSTASAASVTVAPPPSQPSADTAASPMPSESSTVVAQGTARTAPDCDRITRPPLQDGSHLLGDQDPPVPYSSHPPTSGWHASGHLDVGVRDADDPLTEPEQVSVLEADGVVVTYHDLSDEDVARLARRVRRRYRGRVAVTPYERLDSGAVAFASWGVLQRCDGLDLATLDRFVDRFATNEPIEVGH
jgi:hypothetical protein